MNKYPVITALLQEISALIGHVPTEGTPEPAAEPQAPATRRGRKPAEPTPVTESAQPAPEPEKKPAASGTVPLEKLQELIKDLVEVQGRGAEVKAAIMKHGGTKLSDLPAASHAAFVRDIEALSLMS